jgi:hypothetical protein
MSGERVSWSMPQLLKRPDTQGIAFLTGVVFYVSSEGEVQGVYRNSPYVFQARLPQASLTADASDRG